MTVLEESLAEIGESVWDQTLGLTLQGCEAAVSDTAMIQGQVRVTGPWSGLLVLECSELAARRAAAVMFGLPDDSLSGADVHDAVGELANILGGTVKSLVAEDGCTLSLPVADRCDAHASPPSGMRVLTCQHFNEAGEPVVVTVLETAH